MTQQISEGAFFYDIRRAKPSDAEAAAKLIRMAIKDIAEALTGEEEEEQILEVIALFFKKETNRLSYENCFVCEINGAVAGLILYYYGGDAVELDEPLAARLRSMNKDSKIEKEADEEDLYIDTLCVNPEFRGKGIGTALVEYVERHMKEKEYKRFSLVVEQNNAKAQKLYTGLGYLELKKIMIHDHLYEYRVKIVH